MGEALTDDKDTLLRELVRALPPESVAAAPEAAALLERGYLEGRARWSLELTAAAFARHVAGVLPGEAGAELLERLRLPDLYLACACAEGVAGAVDAIEAAFFGELDPALRQMGASPSAVQEIKQRVRDTLFVGPDPRIRGYSGRGDLRAWLRSVAVRQALKTMRDDRRGGPAAGEDALSAVADDADDPALEHLKATYAGEFNRALTDALTSLSPRERTVLKQSYLDGLSIDEIGALYRVHRATAARWIARAREVLMDETRDLLVTRLQLTASEVGSVARLVASQLDVSLSRLLGA